MQWWVALMMSPTHLGFNTRQTDPASAYGDPVRRDAYLKMYGNICYDTRDQYVNFRWSLEQK